MNRIQVLLVDDNEGFADGVSDWLGNDAGLEVVGSAKSGQDALELVDRLTPDLVLTDLTMPDMNGFEVTRRIKSRKDAPRVVVMTLHESETARTEAWSAGADGFVAKAMVMEQLMSVIEELFPDRARKGPRGEGGKAHQSGERGLARDLNG